MQRKASGASAGAASKPPPAKDAATRTAEAHALSGPMSLGNFEMSARPNSRGGREASRRSGGALNSSSGQQPPGTRNRRGPQPEEPHNEYSERPGTRSGRGAAVQSVSAADGWGDMFAADDAISAQQPAPARDGRPSSRQGRTRQAIPSSGKGNRKLQPTQPPEGRPRGGGTSRAHARDKAPSAGGADSDEELERIIGDADWDAEKADDADFKQFLLTGESHVLHEPRPAKPRAPQPPAAPIPPTEPQAPNTRGERKHRSEKDKEEKRGEIVDHLIERMIRAAEQDVSENSLAYYNVGLFRKKSLKEASVAMGAVLDAAWATIDLEIKLAAIEQLEMASQAEADVWLKDKLEGHDWQYRMRQELMDPELALAADEFAALPNAPAALLPVAGARWRPDEDDAIVDDEAILRAIGPIQDPLDALVATKLNTQQAGATSEPPDIGDTGVRMSVDKLPSRAGQGFTPTMAHHGLRRLR
eukprot:jgi/Tetstr1/466431/TSEL_010959.t1